MSMPPARPALQPGYTPVPDGCLAAVVTWLEITDFPPMPLAVPPAGFSVRAVETPDPSWYRALFRTIGAPWLWVSRLRLSDHELSAIIQSPSCELFVVEQNGEPKAMLELNWESREEVELAYLGVAADVIGAGIGRFLMDLALSQVIQNSARRFWVHTCTLDHPRALEFYIRSGFRPYRRAVEVFEDPRISGELPLQTAPQIPLITP